MIPLVINNFNRLGTTRKLCRDGKKFTDKIIILDNGSTYPPLLGWYKTCGYEVIYLPNIGSLALYSTDIPKRYKRVIYTDSDIELNPNTPNNLPDILLQVSQRYKTDKVGLGLRIDDLPDTEYANTSKEWELPHWKNQLEPNIYKAYIDTTFSLLSPGKPFTYEAIRVCYPNLIAKHLPWYIHLYNLSEEDEYFIEHSNEYSTLKRYYNTHIKK